MEVSRQKWLDWLKIKGLSERTLKEYLYYFDTLDFGEITQENLLNWIGKHNNNVARAMLKNLLHYIKLGEFPQDIKVLASFFEIPKQTGRKKKRVLRILTREQIHQVARRMERPRDRCMVLTTFYLGLRISELRRLHIESFNWKSGTVRIMGKGDKERVLPVYPLLQKLLAEYCESELGKNPEFYKLFTISTERWGKILGVNAEKSIGRWVNTHLLRHSTGTYLQQQGLDLKEIAEFLGHADVSSTQIYVHLDKKQLNTKVMNAFQ